MFRDVSEPKHLPNYLALVGKEPESFTKGDLDLTFDVVQFVEKKFGSATSFKSVTEYLFWLNDQYRRILPGRKYRETPNEQIKPLATQITWRLEGILGKGNAGEKPVEQPKETKGGKQPREEL